MLWGRARVRTSSPVATSLSSDSTTCGAERSREKTRPKICCGAASDFGRGVAFDARFALVRRRLSAAGGAGAGRFRARFSIATAAAAPAPPDVGVDMLRSDTHPRAPGRVRGGAKTAKLGFVGFATDWPILGQRCNSFLPKEIRTPASALQHGAQYRGPNLRLLRLPFCGPWRRARQGTHCVTNCAPRHSHDDAAPHSATDRDAAVAAIFAAQPAQGRTEAAHAAPKCCVHRCWDGIERLHASVRPARRGAALRSSLTAHCCVCVARKQQSSWLRLGAH